MFGLFVFVSHVQDAQRVFHIVAIAVATSLVLHATTDTIAVKWMGREDATHAAA